MNLFFLQVSSHEAIRLNYFQRAISIDPNRRDNSNRFEVFWMDFYVKKIDLNDFYTPEDCFDIEKLHKTESEFYARLATEKEKFIPFTQYGKKIFEFESMKKESFELQNQLLDLLRSFGHPFFKDEEIQGIFDCSQPYVIGMYGILSAIQFYKQQIEKRIGSGYDEWMYIVERNKKDYYTEAESTERLTYLTELYEKHARVWSKDTDSCKGIFNLLPESEDINLVSSDMFEYEIINLYNILHNFEWGKKVLVLCVGEV